MAGTCFAPERARVFEWIIWMGQWPSTKLHNLYALKVIMKSTRPHGVHLSFSVSEAIDMHLESSAADFFSTVKEELHHVCADS